MANINLLVARLNEVKAQREEVSNAFLRQSEYAASVMADHVAFVAATEEMKNLHVRLAVLDVEYLRLEEEILEANAKLELAEIEREYKWNIFLINVGSFFRRVLHEIKWFPWLPLRLWEGWDRKKK